MSSHGYSHVYFTSVARQTYLSRFCRFSIRFYDNSCITFSSPEGIRCINDVLISYPLLASNGNGLINDLILL